MDEDNEALPNHLFISLRHEFKATRIIGQRLSPTTIKVKTDISTLEEDTDEYGSRMEVALAKMNFFVDKILSDTIIIHSESEWAMDRFLGEDAPSTDNHVMMCPEEATDAVLCEILICKFKALSQGAFDFHSIEIESSDARGMSFMFVGGSPGESFPEATDWLTERNYFSKPWWHRNDASTLDIIPDEEVDLNQPPAWAFSLGFIADQLSDPSGQSNVIVCPEFRPKIIEGGKVV